MPVILELPDYDNTRVAAARVEESDVLRLEAAADVNVEVLVPPKVLVNADSVTVEGSGVPEFAARAVPVVLDVKGDELLEPAGAVVRAGTGVVVAMIPVLLDHVDASTLVPIAVAKDDASLLKTCVNGGGRAVPVILEMAADVNTSVVASLVAENEVLLLELAANADVEGLVLVNVVSATVEGSEGSVFDTLAVLEVSPHVVSVTVEGSGVPEFAARAAPGGLDVKGDELLDPAGAEVRAETGVVVAMIPVLLDHVDAKDGALLLKTCANGVGGAHW